MSSLFSLLKTNSATTRLLEKRGIFVVDETVGAPLLIATAFKEKPEDLVIITSNLYNAQQVYEALASLLSEEEVYYFPMDEMLRSESLAASKEMLAQRLYVLANAQKEQPKIIVANLAAAMRYLPSPKLFNEHTLKFSVGERYEFENITRILTEAGYTRVNKIDQSLQFALRGDILDIYSVNLDEPVRIEFFDDEVESIRYFEIATQASHEEINSATILPASDTLLSLEARNSLKERINNQLDKDIASLSKVTSDELIKQTGRDIERLLNYDYHISLYKYYGFVEDIHFNLLNYLNKPLLILNNDFQINEAAEMLEVDSFNYLREMAVLGENITHLAIYQPLTTVVGSANKIIRFREHSSGQNETVFNLRPIVGHAMNMNAATYMIESYLNENKKVLLALSTRYQLNSLKDTLTNKKTAFEEVTELNLPSGNLGLTSYYLEQGFELVDENVVVISSRELYGTKGRATRFQSRFKEATILRSYSDLNPGDYVVHEKFGIGQFLDIKTMLTDDIHQDYLHIQYFGKDVLYVPLSQFRFVRKYVGREGVAPRLNRLNSNEWDKTKSKISERVNEIADQLVELYSERLKGEGFAFPHDDEWQVAFENEFAYELTSDQARALREIKADMENIAPMDRLLSGDVGFGKTEIAFRAAFKAISAGKQVAFLCPTTLLAKQHYELALERFSTFGIKIKVLSRLESDNEKTKVVNALKDGEIDLIIGTHRLLSKDIRFKDLGLLIIDEEQRFGVEQKEKIKGLKTNVDVLTLSATPIPRTLQMSLVGIRTISQITTAPLGRMPIQTYVMVEKDSVVKELIERELGRKGQVFYLHNRVSTIYSKAAQIQKMIPNAVVGVIHGQMDKNESEDVMMRFYSGEITVLVCTTIIENGLDIANANTMIIEQADRFGLAQLYQIKGRVGRGNRIAYAYLLYKPHKQMTEAARKRLQAIQDFTELGSGYKIAQRDLVIRGAGDLLGPEQAGFIDTVGVDMYLKLLNDAITKKKTGKTRVEVITNSSSLHLDAYIPTAYALKSDKIDIYHEIDEATTIEQVDVLASQLRDIYGRLPNEVSLLLRKRKLDINLAGPEFEKMEETSKQITIYLSAEFARIDGIGTKLFQNLIPLTKVLKFKYANRELKMILLKDDNWFENLETLVEIINETYARNIDSGE